MPARFEAVRRPLANRPSGIFVYWMRILHVPVSTPPFSLQKKCGTPGKPPSRPALMSLLESRTDTELEMPAFVRTLEGVDVIHPEDQIAEKIRS